MKILYDFRSDTVTRPTPAMREAMLAAEVGDDVYGEDATVSRLEAVAADRLGKEVGLFFPSGTQANLAAVMSHCERGDEYIVGQMAHCYRWEGGGAAVFGSVQPQPLANQPDGSLDLDEVASAVKPDDPHYARTRLVALENTFHGRVLPVDYPARLIELARSRGLRTHLDGARLFNAAIAGGRPVASLASGFDTVSICLSKGLGAPVGSVLAGRPDLIARARRFRKMLGGGMRQSGMLAAAGLYALENHVDRLAIDHGRARRLAEGLSRHVELSVDDPETNILLVRGDPPLITKLAGRLAERGIGLASLYGGTCLRWVVHLDIDDAAIDAGVAAVDDFFSTR